MKSLIGFFALFFVLLPNGQEVNAAEVHNIIGCSIIGMDKVILRNFPGSLCLFFQDGSLASAQNEKLVMYSSDGEVRWTNKLDLHHQLNIDPYDSRLLSLTSDNHELNGRMVRFDTVLALDLNGKLLGQFSLFDHKNELDKFLPPEERNYVDKIELKNVKTPGVTVEATHVNSVYGIPANPNTKRNSAFSPGNYIVNVPVMDLVLILNHDLTKILWHLNLAKMDSDLIHDLQILPNGHLLFYSNMGIDHSKVGSHLVEFDPIKKRPIWSWSSANPADFASPIRGGVQFLSSGNVLFSDGTKFGIAKEITRSGVTIWEMPNPLRQENGLPEIFQQIKRYDLTSFLKLNKFL